MPCVISEKDIILPLSHTEDHTRGSPSPLGITLKAGRTSLHLRTAANALHCPEFIPSVFSSSSKLPILASFCHSGCLTLTHGRANVGYFTPTVFFIIHSPSLRFSFIFIHLCFLGLFFFLVPSLGCLILPGTPFILFNVPRYEEAFAKSFHLLKHRPFNGDLLSQMLCWMLGLRDIDLTAR